MLALVTDAYGGYGGIAQYNRDFLEAMARLSAISEIHILPRLAPDSAGPLPGKIRQHRPLFGRLAYSLRAGALCLARRPDLIFSGHVYHGPLAVRLAKLTGARLVSQLHGTEIWKPLAERHIRPLRKSELVLCVSEDTKRRYQAQGGANSWRLPNTFDARYTVGDRAAARSRFGLGKEFVILTVSRLDGRGGYKGHDRVIAAMPRILTERPDSLYLIAGVGEDQGRLEQLAGALGVGHRVRFLGKVPHAALPDLYRAADLFALPSTGEGFGIVFIEATACGTPAIGLAIGGATDALIFPGRAEAVAPEAFPEALAEMVERAGAMTEMDRQALSRSTIETFGKAVFNRRTEMLLDHLLNENL